MEQQFNFVEGLNTDLDPSRMSPGQYREAVNMYLTENAGHLSMANLPNVLNLSSQLDVDLSGFQIMYAASCTITVGPAKIERPGSIIWFQDASGRARIVLLDSTNNIFSLIYDDTLSPTRDRQDPLNLTREIDAYHYAEGGKHWVYWTDGENPLRRIEAHVEEQNVWNNSISPYSSLYIPNEPDLLLVQRLWPVDMPVVSDIKDVGGGLKTGKYSFAYRYTNSENNVFSSWSLICLGVNITPTLSTDGTNEANGGGINTITSKSIELTIDKQHFHHQYYDSIQIAAIRKTGTDTVEAKLLSPSKSYYGSQLSPSVIEYTGNEATSVVTINEIVLEEAHIQTSTTIEISEGRIFLASPKYWDLKIQGPITFSASTHVEEIPVQVDPMNQVVINGQGYYDEMNELKKGYFRGEVYPFNLEWVNKFGFFSFPYRLQFPTSGRYDQLNHASTWQLNWSDSSGSDWKFPKRNSQEGSMFNSAGDSLRAFGLQLSNIIGHPDWAYGVCVTRAERKKDIVAQTPVIHSMAVQGIGRFESETAADQIENSVNTDKASPVHVRPGLYDYDGNLDTYLPRMLAHGHTKHYVSRQVFVSNVVGQNDDRGVFHLSERLAYWGDNSRNVIDNPKTSLVYLYPLEYIANNAGEILFDLEGDERLDVIDLVALESYSNIINADDTLEPPVASYGFGRLPRYSFIYSPRLAESYYYHNNGVGTLASDVQSFANLLKIEDVYRQTLGGGPIVTTEAYSNRDVLNHIRIIDGLQQLVDQQTENPNQIWKDFQFIAAGPTINQRSLVVSLEHDSSQSVDFLYDPTARILDEYITNPVGGNQFSDLFGNSNEISDRSILEDSISPFSTSSDAQATPFSRFAPHPNTVPIYIVNIVRGLSDNRYANTNEPLTSHFTGAYLPLGTTELTDPNGVDMTVFGGDCYITRLIAQIRNNAPYKEKSEIIDSENYSHLIESSNTSSTNVINQAFKCTAYTFLYEEIDLWIESTVNGHYVQRSNSVYPKGIESRDISGQIDVVSPPASIDEFYNPSNSALQMMSASRTYLYNLAYSSENNIRTFTFPGDSFIVRTIIPERIHYSNQKILNSQLDGFDRFFTSDSFDLDGTFGKIWKLLRGSNKRLYAFQHNGVAQLQLSRSLIEDAEGFLLSTTSGQVIGYAYYINDNQDGGGEFGIQGVQSVIDVESGIFGFDFERRSAFMLSGDTIKSISYLQVEREIESKFNDPNPSSYGCWYHPKTKRSGILMRGENSWKSLNFYHAIGKWEGLWEGDTQIVQAFIPAGKELYAMSMRQGSLVNTQFYIGKMFDSSQPRDTLFGITSESSLEIILNEQFGIDKMIQMAMVVSNRAPSSIQAKAGTSFDVSLEDIAITTEFIERQRGFYATAFITNGEERIRDSVIPVKIVSSNDSSPLIIESILIKFRTSERHATK